MSCYGGGIVLVGIQAEDRQFQLAQGDGRNRCCVDGYLQIRESQTGNEQAAKGASKGANSHGNGCS